MHRVSDPAHTQMDRWSLYSTTIRMTTAHMDSASSHNTAPHESVVALRLNIFFEHRKRSGRFWHMRPQQLRMIFWRIILLWNFAQRHWEAFCEFDLTGWKNYPADTPELRFHFMVSWLAVSEYHFPLPSLARPQFCMLPIAYTTLTLYQAIPKISLKLWVLMILINNCFSTYCNFTVELLSLATLLFPFCYVHPAHLGTFFILPSLYYPKSKSNNKKRIYNSKA